MSYGYSARLIELNRQADRRLLGVRLGRICIEQGIPVSDVASELGVTRQTIYNWFCGESEPTTSSVGAVEALLSKYANEE